MTAAEQFQLELDTSLGGSALGTILGLDDAFGSKLSIYHEKVEGQRTEPTDAMEEGTALEPVIRAKYERNTGLIVRDAAFMRHPKHRFVAGHPDGLAGPANERADRIWEAKRIGSTKDWGEEGSDQVPKRVVAQVQQYMHVWNELAEPANRLAFADVTARDKMSMTQRDYRVDYSREWCMDVMMPALISFWNDHIVPRIPPDPTVGEAKDRYPTTVEGHYVEASEHLVALWDEYLIELAKKDAIDERVMARRHQFEMAMGDEGDHLVRPDGVVLCTWKNGKPATRIDTKALKSQYPEVYERLAKTSDKPTRTFLAKLTNGGDE